MENTGIVPSGVLQAPQAEQTVTLLVDSFYPMFKGISKDRDTLRRLFTPCLRPGAFYVLLEGDQVAGLIALSDYEKRAIMIDKGTCISIFGAAKGKILAWQLRKILGTPMVDRRESRYIDFLATSPEYRRQGVAARLLNFAEEYSGAADLYLDVLASNEPAIRLYEKSGYQTECVKKNIWMRLAGINAMHIMKKDLQ